VKEKFEDINFRESSRVLIQQADKIIKEYQARGFTLTLRQLYYQFVSRDIIANKQTEYKRLGKIVNDARVAGLLDWSAIEDRTRNVKRPNVWRSPEAIIRAVADQYQEDPWIGQEFRPEVWIEKDALVGVIESICEERRVPFFACRGYVSQSEAYDAGKRFQRVIDGGQRPLVLHLGDHDPSGLDMTRNIDQRLYRFAGMNVEVRRLALNMDQIDKYGPPPNPAKDTDARFEGYQDEFGDSSWELDALDPTVISDLIETELSGVIEWEKWDAAMATEESNKEDLSRTSVYWSDVKDFVRQLEEDDSN
jgi:hypothetical protein